MPKKITIKDIAKLAGVSAGSVDRVIHNRGEVSPETRNKVETVLNNVNYIPNLHSKSNSSKKLRLLVILPQHVEGEYWAQIKTGIEKAHANYNSFNLIISYLYYNQYNVYSCKKTFCDALSLKKDAVIIGPSFRDETLFFSNQLSQLGIPYVYVDSFVLGAEPVSAFCPNNFQSGLVQAKLICDIVDHNKDLVLFLAKRIGDEVSLASLERQQGFTQYLKERIGKHQIHTCQFVKSNLDENDTLLDAFFREHTNIGGAVIFNSCAYVISEYFERKHIEGIKIIGFGDNAANTKCLKEDKISFLIEERPEYQGYMAVKTIIEFLFFGIKPKILNYTPIDILIKETVEYYKNPSFAFLF